MNFNTSPTLTCTVPSSRVRTDELRHLAEHGVLLVPLGGHHIVQRPQNGLALHGDLGLGHGVEEQVSPVLEARAAEIVDSTLAEQFHRHQTRVGVEKFARTCAKSVTGLP